jgi:putative ABC transport system permease protein
MGASSANIISLLSVEFLQLILIANVIAWPLAWLVIDQWLNQFAYRTSYGIGVFIIAGIAALLVATGITSVKAAMASRLNPVDTLKYE